ncbi:AraC family transcriptional regulator [Pseudomonas aeruginosa]|nr:AraC family transcriptional regulator [Pseudomonas aeruginosa]KSL14582.1 AraC family transcriptional regulator [Pseudomonas aeruginosa]
MMRSHPVADRGDLHADHLDLAAARSWMSKVCGPHRLEAASPGLVQFQHHGNVLKSMCTTLGYIGYGTDVTITVEDAAAFNAYSLSLPLSGEQELCRGGLRLLSDVRRGVIIAPNERQELSIAGDCRKLQVVIGRTAMRKVLEEMLQRPIDTPLRFDPEMDALDGASASWWRTVRHISEEMARSELYAQAFFSSDLERALIKGLIRRPPHYLLRAREFLQANARETLSLEDVERAAGVSRFKLFEGFRRYFGVSPMSYLKHYRLAAVREEILASGGARSISTIALGWGFSHLGRFSVDYRKRFEETPSMTQRRAARRS